MEKKYSIIVLCFEWKIAKFENVGISKHYKILIMASEKEKNHYDLTEIENRRRKKTFPKGLARRGVKSNFRQIAK